MYKYIDTCNSYYILIIQKQVNQNIFKSIKKNLNIDLYYYISLDNLILIIIFHILLFNKVK